MKRIYRGIKYGEAKKNASLVPKTKTEIVYRGHSPHGKIKPSFPWLKYTSQLLRGFKSKPVLDPITFWYNHKREFMEDCWHPQDREKLYRAWNLTVKIEMAKALKSKPKNRLKYRGVTYYK